VTAVRPPIFPQPPQTPGPARDTRSAAQKAFFDLAMGKAAAAPQAAPSAAPSATPAALQRIPDTDAEKPQKILRPGSLLDIRV